LYRRFANNEPVSVNARNVVVVVVVVTALRMKARP